MTKLLIYSMVLTNFFKWRACGYIDLFKVAPILGYFYLAAILSKCLLFSTYYISTRIIRITCT